MYKSSHFQFQFYVDPTDSYTDADPMRLVEACGFIPAWIDVTNEDSFQKQVDVNYKFGLFEMKGGTVDDNGVYQYPEDPPLYPLLKWERDGEVAYMYQYAIMVFIKDGQTFITRVD